MSLAIHERFTNHRTTQLIIWYAKFDCSIRSGVISDRELRHPSPIRDSPQSHLAWEVERCLNLESIPFGFSLAHVRLDLPRAACRERTFFSWLHGDRSSRWTWCISCTGYTCMHLHIHIDASVYKYTHIYRNAMANLQSVQHPSPPPRRRETRARYGKTTQWFHQGHDSKGLSDHSGREHSIACLLLCDNDNEAYLDISKDIPIRLQKSHRRLWTSEELILGVCRCDCLLAWHWLVLFG